MTASIVVLEASEGSDGIRKWAREALDLFISYAHEDEPLRAELAQHLAALEREGRIRPWFDREIAAGDAWGDQIDDRLEAADLILLLVSSAFRASDYCFGVETTRALERPAKGEARVIPVIARPCDWQGSPFAELQALPKDGKPVTTWANRDQAWLDVARGLRAAVTGLQRESTARQGKHSERKQSRAEKPPSWTDPVLGMRFRFAQPGTFLMGSPGKTLPVRSLQPNPWGLYEVHGNVYDWVWDQYGAYPQGSVTDPTGGERGSDRIVRGGCWDDDARGCRAASRDSVSPENRSCHLGFRLVRTAG